MKFPRVSRRELVVAGLTAAIGSTVDRVFAIFDGLADQVRPSPGIQELIPAWNELQIIPGKHHPNLGPHPDILDAADHVVPLMARPGGVMPLPLEQLPEIDYARDLLLIGGPISSSVSRRLHGYRLVSRKMSQAPVERTGFRWQFYYPKASNSDPANRRYVRGESVSTMPKGIVDTAARGRLALPRLSRVDPDSGFIESDFLLVTIVPSPTPRKAPGRVIVDIADLQGQGDKTFGGLISNAAARRELLTELGNERFFQALYEVPVTHNHKRRISIPGTPKLIGVELLHRK